MERAHSISQSSEENIKASGQVKISGAKSVVVSGVNKPLFHIDLTAALQSAIINIENRKTDKTAEQVAEELAAAAISH